MTLSAEQQKEITYTLGIQYRIASTIFQAITNDETLCIGERVASGTGRNLQFATVITSPTNNVASHGQLQKVRRASLSELEQENVRREQALLHFETCRAKIKEYRLSMKLTDAELIEGDSKIVFVFSAEDRVDFRQLVKELSHLLRLRVEMRHIGLRDEAKYRGCLGACGQVTTCCSTYLRQFRSISIGMAKTQGLALNPSKLTGLCGKLKCCLAYESDMYAESKKGLLKIANVVTTPKGVGRIVSIDILQRVYGIKLDEGSEERFEADQCTRLSQEEKTARDDEITAKQNTARERSEAASAKKPHRQKRHVPKKS